MAKLEFSLIMACLVFYTTAGLFYFKSFGIRGEKTKQMEQTVADKSATYLTFIGFGLNTAVILIRYIRTGHPPMSNMYEFLLLFIWVIIIIYLWIDHQYKQKSVGMVLIPFVVGLMIWLLTLDHSIRPLLPSLRSAWLSIHVATAVIAYGAFTLSFLIAILYFLKAGFLGYHVSEKFSEKIPTEARFEQLSFKMIVIGMPFLTLVLATGAVWAEVAWGTYWSWDPKETWALITWLVYAIYLHVRLKRKWKVKVNMILVFVGFLVMMFTLVGVTYLLPSLHSYV